MRKILTIILLAFVCVAPIGLTSCSTAPSQRSTQVMTLKVVGASVDTSMKVLAELYRDGKITQAQWNKVADIHDRMFLPAYNLAVAAVQANLESIASPDLIGLAAQLASAVVEFTSRPSASLHPKIGDTFLAPDGVNHRTYIGHGVYCDTLAFVQTAFL